VKYPQISSGYFTSFLGLDNPWSALPTSALTIPGDLERGFSNQNLLGAESHSRLRKVARRQDYVCRRCHLKSSVGCHGQHQHTALRHTIHHGRWSPHPVAWDDADHSKMQMISLRTCTSESSHIATIGVQGQHCSFQNRIRDQKHLYHISAQALRVNSVGKEVLELQIQ